MRWLRGARPLLTATALVPTVVVVTALTVPASAATTTSAPRPQAQANSAQPASAAILPPPPGDAFYVPPDPLPAGQPGDIIWYRSSASPVPDATAWQILYLSTTALGGATAVSGTLIVPSAPYSGTRPVVAYAAGTQGWGDQCAPSKEIAAGSFDEEFAVNNLLGKGWAVVITDYPGLGTPGDETYNVGIPEGYAVLDSLRAATRLPGAGLSATAPMAIEGYSQGGGASGWAAQLHARYAPELHLLGAAMGGTPANLQAVAANINGSLFFAFLAGAAIGFNAAYPSLNVNQYLTPAGQAAFQQLDTMCQEQALATYAGKRIEDYTVGGVNPVNDPPWQAVLNANDLGAIKPDLPVLETHGLLDEIIPYSVEQSLHNQYCAMGVATQLNGYPGDHVLTALLDQTDTVNWISDRFAAKPAPSNC
ncbi:MAG: triacylglycerol lipase [Streptosporangiaceae bacterium]|nr:triacylglycerol lipase [Streptosporangiaceae bacterium]